MNPLLQISELFSEIDSLLNDVQNIRLQDNGKWEFGWRDYDSIDDVLERLSGDARDLQHKLSDMKSGKD